MKKVKLSDDESYVNLIKDVVKNYDSYQYIFKEIDMIVKIIDGNIDYVIIDDDNKELIIYLYDNFYYAFNYDNKNYPLLSFNCKEITIFDIDTIIMFDENLQINLYELDIKNFEMII